VVDFPSIFWQRLFYDDDALVFVLFAGKIT